jgi:hypothetical protein
MNGTYLVYDSLLPAAIVTGVLGTTGISIGGYVFGGCCKLWLLRCCSQAMATPMMATIMVMIPNVMAMASSDREPTCTETGCCSPGLLIGAMVVEELRGICGEYEKEVCGRLDELMIGNVSLI